MTTISLAEIVNTARKAETVEEKVAILKRNQSQQLKDLLALMCDARWTFDLPETAPPYNKTESHETHGQLYREMRKMPYFVEQRKESQTVPRMRKESLFIQMLESVSEDDAELVLRMIAKEPYPDLAPEVINQAFPNCIVEAIPVKRGRGRPKKSEAPVS
jgi:hypothetical protein